MNRHSLGYIRISVFLATIALANPGFAFHFTVTADCRAEKTTLATVLDAITTHIGTPAFHVSAGDIDRTVAETRQEFTNEFGSDFTWYPITGNHEFDWSTINYDDNIHWIRDEYTSGHDARPALQDSTNQDGPTSSLETQYTWEHENALFIALNVYWDGVSDDGYASDPSTYGDGQISTASLDWLEDKLAANDKPFVFVFGHEPAYPQNRHLDDSLNSNETTRDDFWELLNDYGVQAYFCGHTHVYSKHQESGYDVYQFDVGNSGHDEGAGDDGQTFLDVEVSTSSAVVKIYRNDTGAWTELVSDRTTLTSGGLPSCPLLYTWDGAGYALNGSIIPGIHDPESERYHELILKDVSLKGDDLVFKVVEIDGEISSINSVAIMYRNTDVEGGQWRELGLVSAELLSAIDGISYDVSGLIRYMDDQRIRILPGDEITLAYLPPIEGLNNLQFKAVTSGFYLWSEEVRGEIYVDSPTLSYGMNTVTLKAELRNLFTGPLPTDARLRFDIIDADSTRVAGYVSVANLPPGRSQWYSLEIPVPYGLQQRPIQYTASLWINESEDITLSVNDKTTVGKGGKSTRKSSSGCAGD